MYCCKRSFAPFFTAAVVIATAIAALRIANIDARGAGLFAQGSARLTQDGRLAEANVTRLSVEGRTNARLTAARAQDGGMDVRVRGAMFDAAPFMDVSSRAPAQQGPSAQQAEPPLRAGDVLFGEHELGELARDDGAFAVYASRSRTDGSSYTLSVARDVTIGTSATALQQAGERVARHSLGQRSVLPLLSARLGCRSSYPPAASRLTISGTYPGFVGVRTRRTRVP